MSLRETLNQKSTLTTGMTIAIIALALVAIVWQLWPRSREPDTLHGRAFYTADEGASYFGEDIEKVPPFSVDGKDAYRAWVFKCGWGKEFVGYMSRYTPEMKKRIEDSIAAGRPLDETVRIRGMEVKRPGDAEWMMATDDRAARYTWMTCPDGKTDPKAVWPDR